MKSIYSKLIFGFFITIVASFSVAGFVSLRLNDQQIESTVEEDLIQAVKAMLLMETKNIIQHLNR